MLSVCEWDNDFFSRQNEKFQGDKNREDLVEFILSRLPTGEGIAVTQGMAYNWKKTAKLPEDEGKNTIKLPKIKVKKQQSCLRMKVR